MILPSDTFIKKAHQALENLGIYICEGISSSPSTTLPPAYSQYTNMFNEKAETNLPPHWGELDYAIELKPGSTALFSPLYNLSEYELGVLKDYLNKNLHSSFIAHSKSPTGALILFIKKKDGSLRLCVNYHSLNAVTIKDKYSIPLISEILD